MIPRLAAGPILDKLTRFPAVALLGPRQSGKTTLAIDLAGKLPHEALYLDLELSSDLAKLSDPELYLSGHENHLVILDEIHRLPGIFQTLRSLIDRRRRKGNRAGQFLLLGSASMELLKQSAESLAGRIAYIELTPFSAKEIKASPKNLDRLWVRGGFPESYLADSDAASLEWRTAFIRTYLERDVPALGPRLPVQTLDRFWRMLAHNQGQLINASRLASGLGVSGQTVARYLDILTDLLLMRRLAPWARNQAKRLVRSPKVYVRDSGVTHALLGILNFEQLLGHPVAGPSWEGFVIENLLAGRFPEAPAWFYRSAGGAEIDLLVEAGDGELWAMEIKRSLSPHISRGFKEACEDVGATRRLVLYPGKERYPIDRLTEAVPVTTMFVD